MADSNVLWTKELVQEHARVAVAIELYTVPFYTTVMTSIKIKDGEKNEVYEILRGILIEEMMHMQLAANLCVALDTTPQMGPPSYAGDIPYLNPGVVINADMEPFNARTLAEMMAIETPEETLEGDSDPTPNGNEGPQFPYSSIGEMYDALLCGIEQVGVDKFSWKTENQQQLWVKQRYPQIIRNIGDAEKAIEAIKQQGEGGKVESDIRKPYEPSDFPVDKEYQMDNRAPDGTPFAPNGLIKLKELSHYGRLLKIQQDALHNNGLPEVYTGENNPKHDLNGKLRIKLAEMIAYLTTLWVGNPTTPSVILWQLALNAMRETAVLTRKCWKNGVIPDWNSLDSFVTQLDLQP